MSPGRRRFHNRRSIPNSLWPLPALLQIAKSSTAPQESEKKAAMRASGKPVLAAAAEVADRLVGYPGYLASNGRAIVGQDAATFPKPLLLGAVIEGLSSFTCYVCKKLLEESLPRLAISAGFC